MGTSYATYEEYVDLTGDETTPEERVEALLDEQSAELRAECGISEGTSLTGDRATLARGLVVDAVRKATATANVGGLGPISGVTQASWMANGFQGQYTMANPSGAAYFDRQRLARLKRLLGRGQRIGTVSFRIGGAT